MTHLNKWKLHTLIRTEYGTKPRLQSEFHMYLGLKQKSFTRSTHLDASGIDTNVHCLCIIDEVLPGVTRSSEVTYLRFKSIDLYSIKTYFASQSNIVKGQDSI